MGCRAVSVFGGRVMAKAIVNARTSVTAIPIQKYGESSSVDTTLSSLLAVPFFAVPFFAVGFFAEPFFPVGCFAGAARLSEVWAGIGAENRSSSSGSAGTSAAGLVFGSATFGVSPDRLYSSPASSSSSSEPESRGGERVPASAAASLPDDAPA